jgi:hypothetical protein
MIGNRGFLTIGFSLSKQKSLSKLTKFWASKLLRGLIQKVFKF